MQRISVLESRVKCFMSKFVLGKDFNMDIAPVNEFFSTCERHTSVLSAAEGRHAAYFSYAAANFYLGVKRR